MTRILFASSNQGKYVEVREVCARFGLQAISASEAESELGTSAPRVEELGTTYSENARLKADAYHAWSGLPSLGDDSGLEVNALGGRPGVLSSRFAGVQASSEENIQKLLGELSNVKPGARGALFRSVLVLAYGPGKYHVSEACLEGEIGERPTGKGGFGYDSVFFIPQFGKTLAQLKEEGVPIKTHRILALEELLK